MNNVNLKLSDQVSIVGAVNPQSGASGSAKTSGWIDVRTLGSKRYLGLIIAGALGAACTLAGKFEQATSNGGAGAKDVAGKAITALTQTPTDQSNKQALINLRPSDLDLDNGFYFIRLNITSTDTTSPTSATSLLAGLILAANDEYQPQTQAATVVQVV